MQITDISIKTMNKNSAFPLSASCRILCGRIALVLLRLTLDEKSIREIRGSNLL